MDSKTIQISEVKDTAPLSFINNEAQFLLTLNENNVKDLKDIKIQKNGDSYIFTLLGNNKQETKFALANGYDVEKFILSFLEQQKQVDENIAVRLSGLEKDQLIITRGTSNEIKALRNEILAHHERTTNPTVINRRINELKKFFDDQKDSGRREQFRLTAKYARSKQERRYREIHKDESERRLKDLRNVEKKMRELDISDPLIENKLKNISQQLDKLSDNVPLFESQDEALRSGTADITPAYNIDATKFSQKDAKDYLNAIKSYNKRQAKVDAITGNATLEQMRAEDLADFQKYLEDIVNNKKDPTKYPYTPKNKEAYEYTTTLLKNLQNEHPYLAKNIVITNPAGVDQGGNVNIAGDADNKEKTVTGTNNDSVNENIDQNTEKGLFSYLDNASKGIQNTTERGQNFYKSFGNVALLAGGIFLGWKAIKSTWNIMFKKDGYKDASNWGWLGGAAGLLLFTAGRPQDLFKGGEGATTFNKILGWIKGDNNKENGAQSPGIEQLAQSVSGASLLFGQETYGKMKDMLQLGSDGKMRIKPDIREAQMINYKNIIQNPTGKTADEINQAKMRKEFLENIGKEDEKGIVDFALKGVGLDRATLSDPKNEKEKFDKLANDVIQRALLINKHMIDNGYDQTNKEVDDRIVSFVKTGSPTLAELESLGVFEKAVDIAPEIKTKLDTQIDALTDVTEDEKKQLHEAVYQFYMDSKADINLEKQNGKLVLTTHNESTPLDLGNKSIPGLVNQNGSAMTFPMTKELLRVANLTNRIKNLTRNLTPIKTDKPFYIEKGIAGVGSRITFDNTERYKVWNQDVTMISNDGLEKISQQLAGDASKDAYVNYLNNQKHRKGGTNSNESFVIPTVATGSAALDTTEEVEEEIDANIIDQEKLQKDIDEINKLDLSEAAKEKIKKDYKEFYQKYPSIKTIGVELVAAGNTLNVNSYRKTTPIDFNKNQVAGLNIDFGNFEDMFKTANLTNKIRSTFENIQSQKIIDPFGQKIANDDIIFDDKSIRNRRPDVAAVSDGLWRGGLRTVSPKLTETSNKQLYIEYLNNLWLMQDKAEGFFPVIENFTNSDTRKKIIDGFKAFYKEHPSEEKNIKFEKDEKGNVSLKTYEQSTPIDLTSKKITGLSLSFETYEELFKVTNAINKAKSVTIDKETNGDIGDDAFDTTYLGALEFYGKEKTIRVFSEDGLTKNSEKFDERSNKLLLESYLNNRWRTIHQTTTPQQ
ncbi:hypothetical protein P148_SR1C00001G0174 [candidate division SR1 bacterium RAAC1_SR1_1]|nr:hypothetical protein P148_SR1C00001G0174 [candidate division SR1 bacterium RAAC1_SR1_1]